MHHDQYDFDPHVQPTPYPRVRGVNGPFPQETRPHGSTNLICGSLRPPLPRPANLVPINGHGGAPAPIFARDASDPGNKDGEGEEGGFERTKPGVINGWDSI